MVPRHRPGSLFINGAFRAVQRKTDIVVSDTSQAAASTEIATHSESLVHVALRKMIYHFLIYTVDLKRGNLIDKLVIKDVISPEQKETVKKLKTSDAKVERLMTTLRQKSAAEFESFLATISETDHESVANVVRQALHTAGQTGQNPLLCHLYGKSNVILFEIILLMSVSKLSASKYQFSNPQ